MRRSSRIILLLGVLLAVVAFVGILALSRPSTTPPPGTVSTSTPTVYAKVDIALGTKVTAEMLELIETKNAERGATAFNSISQVLGQTIRRAVVKGRQLSAADFTSTGQITDTVETPLGLRAMAVQVDQVTGVGTIIKAGDYVDVVAGFTGEKFPIYTNDQNRGGTLTDGGDPLNNTTVKVLIQGIQVLGVLLPPAPVDAQGRPVSGGTAGTTALTGQQELVILAVTPQQAEVIKFAQMDGSISLVLRSPLDFVDAAGQKVAPSLAPTTGIVLKTLVDRYGVLVPQIVQTIFGKP